MTFDLNNLKFNKVEQTESTESPTEYSPEDKSSPIDSPNGSPSVSPSPSREPLLEPLPLTSSEPSPIDSATPLAPLALEGEELLGDLPIASASFKEQLAEIPSLDDLAREFQNSDQPDLFDDAALAAVHKACLELEKSIDNESAVREQLTFIMNELRKYPETAAKVYDSDIAVMVRALRQNYKVVAFVKQANKKAKAEKQTKVKEMLAEAEAGGLFDGLDF